MLLLQHMAQRPYVALATYGSKIFSRCDEIRTYGPLSSGTTKELGGELLACANVLREDPLPLCHFPHKIFERSKSNIGFFSQGKMLWRK